MNVEEKFVLGKSWDDGVKVELSVGAPIKVENSGNGLDWACELSVDPLYPVIAPVRGLSPFDALLTALDVAFQLVRDAAENGERVFPSSHAGPREQCPDDGLTVKEFFKQDY